MDIYAYIERGLRKAVELGASEAEVYVVRTVSTRILGTIKGIESVESGEKIEVGIRVAIGKRVAVQGGMVSKIDDIDMYVERAIKAAKSVSEDPNWVSLPKKLGKAMVEDTVEPKVKDLDLDLFLGIAKEILEKPRSIDKRAYTSIVTIHLDYTVRAIGNIYSEHVSDEGTSIAMLMNIKAVEDSEESGYSDYFYAPTLKELNLDSLISRATSIAINSLRARAIPTGRYDVLLMPKVTASLFHSLIAPAICADNIQKKRSPLAGKLGQQIFSDIVSVVDDGSAPNFIGSRAFDDEGIPTQRKIVFDRGVLENYLYDSYTAYIENRDSTGNATRFSISAPPSPWITNLIVIPGTESLGSMIREIRRGLVVYASIGTWLSNPVSGMVNATITNAVYVENGEPRYPVKGVVLTGNIYELLSKNIATLSKDVENYFNAYAPAILLRDVTIAGK